MRTSVFVAVVAIAGLVGLVPVQAKSDCEPQLLATVPLIVTSEGGVFVAANISGKDVLLQLAISSGVPLITEAAVDLLNLDPKPVTGRGSFYSAGRRVTHFVKLKGMKVGDYALMERAAPVIFRPGQESPPMLEGKPIVGYMGSTLFTNVDAELFLFEKVLRLYKPFRCLKKSPVYWGAEAAELPFRFDAAGALVFSLELDGKRIDASMLNGEAISNIDANITRKFFGFDETSPGIEVVQSGSGSTASVFHAMSLTGQGLNIQDAKIRLLTGMNCKISGSTPTYGTIGYESCINTAPFRLGTDLLSRVRIYISRAREKVYISKIDSSPGGVSGAIQIAPNQQ